MCPWPGRNRARDKRILLLFWRNWTCSNSKVLLFLSAFGNDLSSLLFCTTAHTILGFSENGGSQLAYVTFKDPKQAETALLLSVILLSRFFLPHLFSFSLLFWTSCLSFSGSNNSWSASDRRTGFRLEAPKPKRKRYEQGTQTAVKGAEDAVSSVLAKGFTMGKDTLNKAKSFHQKHQLSSTAIRRWV